MGSLERDNLLNKNNTYERPDASPFAIVNR